MSPDVPEEDVEDAPVSDLSGDVELNTAALPATLEKAKARTANAKAQEADDKNTLRKPLFWVIVGLLGLSYGSTTAMMWTYLAHVGFVPDPKIMIAWISAAIAQLVGLTLVIARYLFRPSP